MAIYMTLCICTSTFFFTPQNIFTYKMWSTFTCDLLSLSSSHVPCFSTSVSLFSLFPPSGMSSSHHVSKWSSLKFHIKSYPCSLNTYLGSILYFSYGTLDFPWFYCNHLYCDVCRVFRMCLALFTNILFLLQPINSVKGKSYICFISVNHRN